jgi:hypothetical protein
MKKMLDAGCWEGALSQHPASCIQHLFSDLFSSTLLSAT